MNVFEKAVNVNVDEVAEASAAAAASAYMEKTKLREFRRFVVDHVVGDPRRWAAAVSRARSAAIAADKLGVNTTDAATVAAYQYIASETCDYGRRLNEEWGEGWELSVG